MQIILLEQVQKLGKPGTIIEVKNGYARNFLIPQRKALRATKANLAVYEEKRAEWEAANAAKKAAAEEMLSKLESMSVTLIRQAGEDDRLYGSVSSREIAEAIAAKLKQDFDPSFVSLNGRLKTIGTFQVSLALHPEVHTSISVTISRTEEKAA